MIRTKIFKILVPEAESEINKWLSENRNIKILSTNVIFSWGYIILYDDYKENKTYEQEE